MIQLDIHNIFSKPLGMRHGLREAFLSKFIRKNEKLVDVVFKKKNQAGYVFTTLGDQSALLSKIKRFVTAQKKYKWENVVVLGIGGSSLGLIAMQEALLGPLHNLSQKPRLFVVDNVDPTYTQELLNFLNLKKTLFVVISKSGTTVEPMALYGVFKEALVNQVKDYAKHFVFITDPKSGVLRKIAKQEKVQTFDVPAKIGGRFSALTPVGLVPAALVGIDIGKLLKGARGMRDELKKNSDNKALYLAAIQFLMDKKKGKSMTIMMPYSQHLFRMGDWYRQLLAESIGKNAKSGPTPINALGATDQHSQLQLWNEGPNNKLIVFLTLKKHLKNPKVGGVLPKPIDYLNGKSLGTILDAAYQGTAEALTKHKRPNLTLTLDKIGPESLGEMIMLLEFQIVLLGLLYKVDAFNQPGVEDSKKITKQILSK